MPDMRRAVRVALGCVAGITLTFAVSRVANAEDIAVPSTRAAASTPIRIKTKVTYLRVILDEQRVYAYNSNRRLVATLPASTGLLDTTPIGRFKVFSKSAQTFYAPDPRERMRWMVRFTTGPEGGNIGFHSIPYVVTAKGEVKIPTPLGNTPSSHGCVRVADADAKWLFDNVPLGTTVIVQQSR